MSTLTEYLPLAKAHPERFVNPPEGGITILLGEDEIREVEAYMAQKLEAKGLPLYQGQVLLVRRFHHATRAWHLEIPIGLGMRGLSGEDNARRVLVDEVGASVSRLLSIGELEEGPGLTQSPAELFYADVDSLGEGNTHEGITEVLLIAVPAFERLIFDGEITDSFTIIAYLQAKLQGLL